MTKPIKPQEADLPEIGKVVPFPKRSGGRNGAHRRELLTRLPITPYGEFSFLPIALQRWRKRNGLKLTAAARGLGVATSTWGHWETGFRFPTGRVLLSLVQYTGLSLVDLLCEHSQYCPAQV